MPSLHEISELFDSKPEPQDLIGNTLLFDFLKSVEKAGVQSLSELDVNDKISAISCLQSAVVTELISEGNLNQKEFDFLLSDKFSGIVATIFKLSVGIACMEELR